MNTTFSGDSALSLINIADSSLTAVNWLSGRAVNQKAGELDLHSSLEGTINKKDNSLWLYLLRFKAL
jgi:hypothetical protein